MCVKKWICCAILLYICYLIVNYLDKPVESFGGGGGGGRGGIGGIGGFGRGGIGGFGRGGIGGFGRGGIGGFGRGGYYGGRGGYYGGYYGGRAISYPIVVNQDYYPSYWHRYIPFFGY
jgi:hypothetical protein